LHINIDLLLTVTKTASKLLRGINIDDSKRPWIRKIKALVFIPIFGCDAHFKNELEGNGKK